MRFLTLYFILFTITSNSSVSAQEKDEPFGIYSIGFHQDYPRDLTIAPERLILNADSTFSYFTLPAGVRVELGGGPGTGNWKVVNEDFVLTTDQQPYYIRETSECYCEESEDAISIKTIDAFSNEAMPFVSCAFLKKNVLSREAKKRRWFTRNRRNAVDGSKNILGGINTNFDGWACLDPPEESSVLKIYYLGYSSAFISIAELKTGCFIVELSEESTMIPANVNIVWSYLDEVSFRLIGNELQRLDENGKLVSRLLKE